MGIRELASGALVLFASACLGAPPDGAPQPPQVDDQVEPGPQPADASPLDCDTEFAVAYVDQLAVLPAGGEYVGMAVIEAIGDEVDFARLIDGADDSFDVELGLSQPAYDVTPSGTSRGELEPGARDLIVNGDLIAAETWDAAAPTFQLTLGPVAADAPMVRVTADLWIGDSRAVLEFTLRYDRLLEKTAEPLGARRVVSSCGG